MHAFMPDDGFQTQVFMALSFLKSTTKASCFVFLEVRLLGKPSLYCVGSMEFIFSTLSTPYRSSS